MGLWQGRIELAGKTIPNAGRKMTESEKSDIALPVTAAGQKLADKPQSYDNIQINRNGLN